MRGKGRLQPGKLFLIDLEQGRIVPDDEMDDVELADEGHQALELAVLADFAAPAEFSITAAIELL